MKRCKNMNFKSTASLIFVTFFLVLSCTIHRGSLTEGTVVETLNSVVYLDIQRGSRASVGQELNVYETILYPKERLATGVSKGTQTGKVKITEILDNRFAKAVVISGKAEKGDQAESVHQN